jgi:hypothetical protein
MIAQNAQSFTLQSFFTISNCGTTLCLGIKIVMLFAKKYYPIVILIVASIVSIYMSLQIVVDSPYQDLRTRAFATRFADANESPYFFQWSNADDLKLFNAAQRQQDIVNGFTGTPTVLLLTSFVHQLPLFILAVLWFGLCYVLFFVIQFSLFKNAQSNILKIAIALFGLIAGWRLHCSAGQIYIVYTAFAIAGLYFFSKNKMGLAALFLALLFLCRLPFVLLIVPLIIWKNKTSFFAYLIIASCAILGLTMLVFGSSIWQQYFEAMQYYGLENANAIPKIINDANITIPNTTEGVNNFVTDNMAHYLKQVNPDVFSVQKLLVKFGLPYQSSFLMLLFAMFSSVIFMSIHFFHKNFFLKKDLLILFTLVLIFSLDYFLPALRFNYNFVQFFVLIAFINYAKLQWNNWSKILLLVGVLMNIIKFPIPEAYSIGEVFCLFAVLLLIVKNNTLPTNEIFEYNWFGKYLLSIFRLQPKVVIYK